MGKNQMVWYQTNNEVKETQNLLHKISMSLILLLSSSFYNIEKVGLQCHNTRKA